MNHIGHLYPTWSARFPHFLDHGEPGLIWLHTSSTGVLFSLNQWLDQATGILTDCLSTVEFYQNKHPLATSFIESLAHVCSTNRPCWDGITVFTSAFRNVPASKTNTSINILKICQEYWIYRANRQLRASICPYFTNRLPLLVGWAFFF